MKMQSILIAFFVSFGLTLSVKSKDQTFGYPYDSVIKSDENNARTYRNFLEQRVEREQQAFDTVKQKLRFERQDNAHKRRNSQKDGDFGGRAVAFKRDIFGNKNGPVWLFPDDQPGCIYRPDAHDFFAYNSRRGPNMKDWLCEEAYEEKLRICVELFQKTTQGKVETSYEILRDKETVSMVCEKRNLTFTQQLESGEVTDASTGNVRNKTIEVDMFACPITKMDLRFPVPYLQPELFDMYISLGRNDVTIAALRDSVHLDNICVRDVYLYPPAHLRSATTRSRPYWPDEIRDFKYMDDAYFERLINKLYSRKMATATGEMFELYSTIMDPFTNKNNATTATPEKSTSNDETTDSSHSPNSDSSKKSTKKRNVTQKRSTLKKTKVTKPSMSAKRTRASGKVSSTTAVGVE